MTDPVTVRLDDIIIGERFRKDFGDIDALAASIKEQGLLQPIAVTTSMRLVAGERRIRAVRQLGMDCIPAHIVDPAEMLTAERDENTVRKDFTPTEAVAIGREIEALHKAKITPEHRSRMSRQNRVGRASMNEEDVVEPVGTAETVASKAVGLSPATYSRAKQVVNAAESDPGRFGDLPQQMDETKNVAGTHREMKRRRSGTEAPQPIPENRMKNKTGSPAKFVGAVATLAAQVEAFAAHDIPTLDDEQTSTVTGQLRKARAVLSKTINKLEANR